MNNKSDYKKKASLFAQNLPIPNLTYAIPYLTYAIP